MSINNNERRVCRYCGEEFDTQDGIFFNDEFVCDECKYEYLLYCDRCEEWHEADEVDEVRTYPCGNGGRPVIEYWCDECREYYAFQCHECGDWIDNGAAEEVRGGHFVCPCCIDDCYYFCNECEEYVPASQFDTSEDMCLSCLGENLIVRYHGADASYPRFYASGEVQQENTNPLVGVEIEIDRHDHDSQAERKCAKELHKLLGERAVFERDGSLSNGFEIVVRPHSFKAFEQDFPLDELLKICRDNGYLAHDIGTCGLHFHISRAYFGKTETARERSIGKCLAFYDLFFDDLVRASRRRLADAENWASRVPVADMKDARKKAKPHFNHSQRYCAVNMEHGHTVEFRLMRGTLNPNTFKACADLVLSIARNSKRCSWETATTTPAEMLRGIDEATAEYLKRRGAFLFCIDDVHTAHSAKEVQK